MHVGIVRGTEGLVETFEADRIGAGPAFVPDKSKPESCYSVAGIRAERTEPVHAVEVEAPQTDGLKHENNVVAHESELETQAVVDVRQ